MNEPQAIMKADEAVVATTASAEISFPVAASQDLWNKLLDHRELIIRICLGLCRNGTDASDMAQETFCKAFSHREAIEKLTSSEHVKLWLCRIARTTCLDHLRATKRRSFFSFDPEVQPSRDHNPETCLMRAEEGALFRAALSGLPRRQRDVLVLREYGQLSYREIAKVLRIKEGTVMSLLLRARRKVHSLVWVAIHETR